MHTTNFTRNFTPRSCGILFFFYIKYDILLIIGKKKIMSSG